MPLIPNNEVSHENKTNENTNEPKQRKSIKTPVVNITKRIPKIALNFTKWKLQIRMVTELKQIKDPVASAKRIGKYTECFDLLDRLGADNCIDPEDFDQEDLNDDLFKNL